MRTLEVIPTYVAVYPTPDTWNKLSSFYTRLTQLGYKPLPLKELHVTLVFSLLTASEHHYTMLRNPAKTFTATVKGSKQLGKWTVLLLESEDLDERHKEWIDLGLIHSYESYLPHLSVSKCDLTEELKEFLEEFDGTSLTFNRESIVIGHKD